jgi:hypothetical protein
MRRGPQRASHRSRGSRRCDEDPKGVRERRNCQRTRSRTLSAGLSIAYGSSAVTRRCMKRLKDGRRIVETSLISTIFAMQRALPPANGCPVARAELRVFQKDTLALVGDRDDFEPCFGGIFFGGLCRPKDIVCSGRTKMPIARRRELP